MHFLPIFPISAMLKSLVVTGPCNSIKSSNIYQKLLELKPCIGRFYTAKGSDGNDFLGPPSSMALNYKRISLDIQNGFKLGFTARCFIQSYSMVTTCAGNDKFLIQGHCMSRIILL